MNRFLQGTIILFVSGIILKIMGFFYQIYIVRTIGTEALGLMSMVHPYYIALVIIATMGLPVAISRLVAAAEAKQCGSKKIMHTAFKIVLVLSIVLVLLALYFMPWLFNYLDFDKRLRWCFYILLPGVIIVPLSSVMRGYFQGKQKMLSPSIGQIAEQICRISIGAGLIYYFKEAYQGYLALFLCIALIGGELGGLMVLSVFYIYARKREKAPSADDAILGEMLTLSIPATLTKLTSSMDMMLEAWILPQGLRRQGWNASESAAIYGQLNNVCFTLISLPGVLTNALSTMLLPSIAALSVTDSHRLQEKCANSLLLTYMFALPIAVIFYLEGGEFLKLIYHLSNLGEIMQILSIGAIFIYLGQTAIGILQGLGKNKAIFLTNLCGSMMKIGLLYLFIWQMGLGAKGACWAFIIAYIVQAVLDIVLLKFYVKFKLSFSKIIIPFILSWAIFLFLPLMVKWSSAIFGAWATIIASIVVCLIYLGLLCLFKVFSWQMLS